MDGLLNCMLSFRKIAAKVIGLWPVVKYKCVPRSARLEPLTDLDQRSSRPGPFEKLFLLDQARYASWWPDRTRPTHSLLQQLHML